MSLDDADRALYDGDAGEATRLALATELTSDRDRLRCARLLAMAGAIDEATAMATRIDDAAARRELEMELREPTLAVDDDEDDEPLDLRRPQISSGGDPEIVAAWLRWFGGRRDLYARQWWDERRQRGGYRPVREPLTAAVARAHLDGRITVGQYLLDNEARASAGVVDLDLSASSVAELRASWGDDVSTLRHEGLSAHIRRLLAAARSLGLAAFPEDSGGRGAHIWLFFTPPRAAAAVRVVLDQLVMAAGPPPADVKIEIFPKQAAPGPRGLSSLVKLPLGLHRATLRTCALLDDELTPSDDPVTALRRLRACEAAAVDAVVGRRILPLPAVDLDPVEAPPDLPATPTPRSLARALRELDDEAAAWDRMTSGCTVLRTLVDRAYSGTNLDADEARAITYTLGLIGAEGTRARDVLLAGGASLKELERARRGRSAPAGCTRLHRLGVAACPGCPSGASAVPYATPALHAVGPRSPTPPAHLALVPWLATDRQIVEGPLEPLRRALDEVGDRLARLESRSGRPLPANATEPRSPSGDDAPNDSALGNGHVEVGGDTAPPPRLSRPRSVSGVPGNDVSKEEPAAPPGSDRD